MSLRNYSLLALTCLFCACGNSNKLLEQLTATLEENQVRLDEKSMLVIIPRSGCSTCIGLADYAFEETQQREKIQVIYTKIGSLKTMRIKLGAETLNYTNVHIDQERDFSRGDLDSLYPWVAFIEGGQVQRVESLTSNRSDLVDAIIGIGASE